MPGWQRSKGWRSAYTANLVGLHIRSPFELPTIDIFFTAYEQNEKADQACAFTAFNTAVKSKDISSK